MAQIKLKGNPVNTIGELPEVGTEAPDFTLTKKDLSDIHLSDVKGNKVVLNIFPSLETSTCAASVRKFNETAGKLDDTVVLTISMDLPYAHDRFCSVEGLNDVIPASVFRSPEFGKEYGVTITDGPMRELMSRAVVVLDENGKVIYTEQVPEISQEPDYSEALKAIK